MLKTQIIDPATGRSAVLDADGRLDVGGRVGAFDMDVPRELGPGWSGTRKFGFNPSVPAAGEVIWDQGVTPYPGFFTTPQPTEVISTDAQDAPGGTGASEVFITGLDNQWRPRTVRVEMNGLTAVPVDLTWLRGYRMIAGAVGANGTNVGDIIWRVAPAGTEFAQITADRGQTLMAIFTVEGGIKRAFLASWTVGISRNQATTGEAELVTRNIGEASRIRDVKSINTQGATQVTTELSPWIELTGKTDILVTISDAGATIAANAGFTVYIEREA